MTDIVEIPDQYDVGYEDGVEAGTESTTEMYDKIIEQMEKDHAEGIEELQAEHELEVIREVKSAVSDEQDKFDNQIREFQYNMETMINDYQQTIRRLMEENYNLRKENATITRSIHQSTTVRNTEY